MHVANVSYIRLILSCKHSGSTQGWSAHTDAYKSAPIMIMSETIGMQLLPLS